MNFLLALFTSIIYLHGESEPPFSAIIAPSKVATVPENFLLETVVAVPEKFGSWVALASLPSHDGRTRVAGGDQYGSLYEITISEQSVTVSQMAIDLSGVHGLLWFQDALYVVVGETVNHKKGVYRARDVNGDGEFEEVTLLREFQSGGEHGVHSLVASPDGKWLYFIAGNYTEDPKLEESLVPKVWDEDQLLPRNPDGRGHAHDRFAPAGLVLRFRPDGSQWQYVSTGYRNPFDGAFNEHGDLFVYDADMEWDMGMPWYRPTRLCWALPGSEYGWRNGSGKWPNYYEDSLPPVIEFGPGSPVGVVSGRGSKFPAKYQRAIFCLDWTFATIYAAHLTPEGHGYRGTHEEFLTGKALPLTDAIVASDGHLYFATGGRKQASLLYRVRYTGSESTADAWMPSARPMAEGEDRWSRFAERVESELAGPEAVRANLGQGSRMARLHTVMALARVGTRDDRPRALEELLALPWKELTKEEKLTWLRALGLVFIRTGEPTEAEREQVLAQIDSDFPYPMDEEVEDELCRMLCYLQAPRVVERTLALLAQPASANPDADWSELVSRGSEVYRDDARRVMRELGSPRKVHFAYCLRVVPGPWTPGQRRQLMDWYAYEENSKGQHSARLALKKMRDDTLTTATEEERALIESWGLEVKRDPFVNLPTAEGPGRAWTVAEINEIAKDLSAADLAKGEQMYQAALCAACHRIGRRGGAAGPDLTNLAGRFSAQELAVALIEPSREISDQYNFQIISKHDGSTVVGKVLDERDEILVVATNPFDFSQSQGISRADIKEMKPSPVSPMPGGLINQFNEGELRDLLGYLLGK